MYTYSADISDSYSLLPFLAILIWNICTVLLNFSLDKVWMRGDEDVQHWWGEEGVSIVSCIFSFPRCDCQNAPRIYDGPASGPATG